MTAGKFREAEAFLEVALATKTSGLQTTGLYNLGTWICPGVQELKKGPPRSHANLSQNAGKSRGQRLSARQTRQSK